jgi:uncharacterized protein
MRNRALPLLLLLSLVAGSLSALEVPRLQGRVNDYAGMISASARARLDAISQELERTDSTQVVVLTIPSLEGEDLEEFSIRVAEAWGIGQKQLDNGALLLVARQERSVRIEVGRGLEGRLTDLLAGRIVDHEIIPSFKAGRYDEGFIRGMEAIAAAVQGEYQAPQTAPAPASGGVPFRSGFPIFVVIALLAFLGSRRRFLGAIAGAILVPILAWLFFPLSLLLLLLIFIPLGGLLGFVLPFVFPFSGRRFRGGGGMFFGGGGGGGGAGGGFSGGGGGFSGGGASGRW